MLTHSTRLGYTHTLMVGDFNLPKVNLSEQMYAGDDDSTKAWFFNLIEDLRLLENVTLTTRYRNS